MARQFRGQRPTLDQAGRQRARAGRALDAVAALPGQPEQARAVRVEADHDLAVGAKLRIEANANDTETARELAEAACALVSELEKRLD